MSAARGFTLLETMIVVVVVGVVLAIGMPSFAGYRHSLLLRQAKQQLLEDMRGARQLAVTRRAPVYVRFGTNAVTTTNLTTYSIQVDKNANGVVDAGDRFIRRTMPGSTMLASVTLDPVNTLAFDISGILAPGTSGGTLVFQNARNVRDTLVVSSAGIAYRP